MSIERMYYSGSLKRGTRFYLRNRKQYGTIVSANRWYLRFRLDGDKRVTNHLGLYSEPAVPPSASESEVQ